MKSVKRVNIVIEVYGGVASVTQTQKGAHITIVDHDNKVRYENVDGINYPSRSM